MGKSVKLISVPYDAAHFNERMGAGPRRIVNGGISSVIKLQGYEMSHEEIQLAEKFATEITSTFNILAQIKSQIRSANQNGSFPIVLSGNCCSTVGVVAACSSNDVGVVWFDAHGDCETPETTSSGFLDGMALSLLLNKCWQTLAASFQLNSGLQGKHVILIGARDVSEYEKNFISENGIQHITCEQLKTREGSAIGTACASLKQAGIMRIHLHIDCDVVDPNCAVANSYSVAGGLAGEDVVKIIEQFRSMIPVSSLTVASYDPSFDASGKMLRIIYDFIKTILK